MSDELCVGACKMKTTRVSLLPPAVRDTWGQDSPEKTGRDRIDWDVNGDKWMRERD